MLIVGNGKILCPDRIIEDGAVYIDGATILETGRTAEIKKAHPKAGFIDAKGGIVMPGLIDLHTHLYSAFARGISLKGRPPKNFVEILDKLWWRLDKALQEDDIYYSALTGLIEAVRCGTTTIIDHHASPNYVAGSLETIRNAIGEIPIRAILSYEVSDRDGKDAVEAGIKENVRFINETAKCDFIRGLFGLHASITLSDATLKRCADIIHSIETGAHVHTAEDRADVDDCRKKYGMGVVERWDKFGLLGPKTILAHCVHISEKDMGLLAKSGTNIAVNPESNLNNAVGTADVGKMLKKGVNVGLGTDGMTMDMFQEARFAHLVQKGLKGDPQEGFLEAGRLLFENNAAIVSRLFGATIGRIEKGAAADIIIVDYNPPTLLERGNFLGHFLYGMGSGGLRATIVGGKVLMQDRKVVGIDEEEILMRSRELSMKLWKRI